MKLVIVESPAKAKTIMKYLGGDFVVRASMGHVRDLPKKKLGVDIDKGFTPEYEVIEGKGPYIKSLREEAKAASEVYLAADPDREGEAIAWHIAQLLKLKNPQRVVFHEITKGVVTEAIKSPRPIDQNLVSAQEARRVIDRLVGYKVSPILWKVRHGTSAGRVQSVAVRLVVDREGEIAAFVPEESWSIEALLQSIQGEAFSARLWALAEEEGVDTSEETEEEEKEEVDEKAPPKTKFKIATEAAAKDVMQELFVDADGKPSEKTPPFVVTEVKPQDRKRQPQLPYVTSSLQQDASVRLRMNPKRTMAIAQQLYEGMELGAEGPVGLITYMRTDSTRVSDEAKSEAAEWIAENFGEKYVGDGKAKGKKGTDTKVQDAHEAIRPTSVERTPEKMASYLDADQKKVYELIWKRFVASQMAPAELKVMVVFLKAGKYLFRASGTVVVFDGFTKVWKSEGKEAAEDLPKLTVAEQCLLTKLAREQHFTQAPPRYTEASLIKALEEKGVGRPSTYAPTLDTIISRNYVEVKERKLYPTELGELVVGWLKSNFSEIIDIAFTAELEQELDGIEKGEQSYGGTIGKWYEPFAKRLASVEEETSVKAGGEPTGEICPECGEGELMKRTGKHGEFVGCSNYPECKYVKRETTGESCPQCGEGELVERQGKRGPFISCSRYPECKYIKQETTGEICPECGEGELVEREGKYGKFKGCSRYPECKYIKNEVVETGEKCPQCGEGSLVEKQGKFGKFVACNRYPECRYIKSDGKGKGPQKTFGKCPECGKPLTNRKSARGAFVGCTGYPECKYIQRDEKGA